MTRFVVAAVVAAVLAGCGGAPTPALPVVTAEPVAPDGVAEGISSPAPTATPSGTDGTGEPEPDGSPTPEDVSSPSPAPTAPVESEEPSTTPSALDVARLVKAATSVAGEDAEHAFVDLDGDDVGEVLVAGVADGDVRLSVWWWTPGTGFGDPVVGTAGRGRDVTSIAVADVTRDGIVEVLVGIGGGGRGSLAVWAVEGRDALVPRGAIGGCFDGTHVYGATGARLQARAGGPPAILAVCDDSPLPVADWATEEYRFADGAYRVVRRPPPPLPPTPSPSPSDDGDDGDDGDDEADGPEEPDGAREDAGDA